MIDPFTALADSATILTVAYSGYTILKSHIALSAKIDALVGVVQSHQVGLDQASKDLELLKAAAMKH